jgi:hypothetical protein
MSKIIFEGPEPFDLIPQMPATAVAEDENVAMTLPVFAHGFPHNAVQIRLLLTADEASQIVDQLQSALISARRNARRGQ